MESQQARDVPRALLSGVFYIVFYNFFYLFSFYHSFNGRKLYVWE